MFIEYVMWLILIYIIYIFVKTSCDGSIFVQSLGFRDNFIIFSLRIVTDVCMRD